MRTPRADLEIMINLSKEGTFTVETKTPREFPNEETLFSNVMNL